MCGAMMNLMALETLFSADKMPVAAHTLDAKGRLIYVNKAWLDFFGYTEEREVVGRLFADFMTEESQRIFELNFGNFLKHGAAPDTEYEVVKKDGTNASITTMGNVWREQRGGDEVINAIIHDVTAQRKTEHRLGLLEIMAEQTVDPMFILDCDARIIDANAAAVKTLGYTREELTKLRIMDIDPKFSEEKWREHWLKTYDEYGYKFETVHRIKSGRLMDVEVAGSYFEHKGRRYKCSVARDITERKDAAAEAARKLDIFKALYELGLKITGKVDLVESLDFILESCCRILGADVSFISLINESETELTVAASHGEISELLQGLHIPADEGLGGRVLELGAGVIVEDYPGDEKISIEIAKVVEAEKAVSGIAVPLSTSGKKKGVLYAFKRIKGAFDTDSLNTLTLFGNIAATEISRFKLRKQLDESQKRLSDIFEFLPDATLAVDRNGNVIAWNRAIEEMSGVRKRDILGKGKDEYSSAFYSDGRSLLVDFIVSDNWEVLNNYNFVKIQGENVVTEVYVETVYGGRGAYLWIMAAPLRDAEGRIVGGLECIRDVTDRRRAEESLREGEARFKTIVTNGPNATVLADPEGVVTYVSPQYETITGYPPETVVGSVFPEYIFPDDREKAMQAAAKLLVEKNEVKDFECRFFNIENQVKWVSISAKVIMLGNVSIGYQCTISDITEKKAAETALKESEARFRAIVTNSPNITILTNPEGEAIYVSPQFEAITGFPLSDIVGKNIYRKIRPDQDETILNDILKQVSERKEILSFESRFINTNSKVVWVSVSATPVRFGDTFMGYQFTVADITERKEAEQAIRERGAIFSTIVTNSPNITILADKDGVITYVSPQYEMITGYKAADLIGKKTPEFVHPEDKPKLSELWKKVIYENLELHNFEYRYFNDENQLRWVSLSAKAITDGEKVIGFQYTGEDVTGKKHAAEALKESEERFRMIVLNSPDMTYTTDGEGTVIFVSPQCEDVLGHPVSKIMGLKFPDFIHPEDLEMCVEKWKSAMVEGKEVNDVEYRIIDGAGKTRWISHTSRLIRIGDKIAGSQSLVRNVTRRVERARELKENEEKYRQLVEHANSIILRMDTEGNITFFNEYAESFLGFSREEIIGKNVVGTIVPETDSSGRDLRRMIQGITSNPERYARNENENMRKDGTRLWLAWSNKGIFDEKGNLVGVHCIGNDITNIKRTEAALRRSEEKLKALSQNLIRTEENERRRLSREIHDELGQQLAIMSLELEWLNGLGDEFQYSQNIRRLANLVEDMSVTTRSICEGLRPPVIDEAGLPSTVEYLVGRFREATSVKTTLHMNIEGVSVTPEIAITVFRILQESLTNIIKYARAKDVSVMLIRDADELILAVRDDGVGFPLDRATNGLGILGMRERAEAAGGTLSVESEVGKGTMVFMRVPLKTNKKAGE